MSSAKTLFSGLSAFPVTPADENGHVAADRFGRLVAYLAKAGVPSIGALGSTGSYAYLSGAERARALEAAVEAAGNTPVIAGVGALTTADAVSNAKAAKAAGASGLLLAPMSYLPLSDAEVEGLVKTVAAATDLPICLYNNPTTTKFTFSEDLIIRLSAIPTIAAVKNPAPQDGDFAGQLARLRNKVPEAFSIGYSGDWTVSGALSAGADAWYSVLGGIFPAICLDMWRAAGDPARLAAVNEQLAPVWQVFARHSSFRVVHAAAEILGFGPATPVPPLLPLSPEARNEAEKAFTAAGLLETVS
ncbi:dihydrodipicolinate synthase family protein [Martelella mangrovi]|uniref:4-hydroxy-tetrahydrodipicolinate synthase n=1 Tax=Martelella mangrovi TaxID=1397477 RepID=A0ABV2I6X1_9HYPH